MVPYSRWKRKDEERELRQNFFSRLNPGFFVRRLADELESLLVGSDQTAAKRPGMFINGHLFLQVDPAPLFCFNSNRFESKLPEIIRACLHIHRSGVNCMKVRIR